MSRKKTQNVITTLAVAVATILAWLSGFFVMQIVYNSIAAAIVFATVVSVIVFCESRFSYISLKSDGKIEITREEIKSNLWQIAAATLVAFLVAIPLELKIYDNEILMLTEYAEHNLGLQIQALGVLFTTNWLPMGLIWLIIIIIYQVPIFVHMASDEKKQ